MAAPVVVNGDVSLILVNTRDLTAGQSAVVLLSSIAYPGRTVTIRDSVGFLSTPQSIVISTIGPSTTFLDGTSSVQITQPFGYLSVTSRDANTWTLTNSFGFPQNLTVANARSLTTSTITACNIYAQTSISTPYLTLATLNATSTLATFGPTYTSTLVVGPPPTVAQPPLTDPGFSAYIQGTARVQGNLEIDGLTRIGGQVSTASNIIVAGNISTLGSFGVRGDIQTLGNIAAPFGTVTASNLDVRGFINVAGPATFGGFAQINSSLLVFGQVSTPAFTTSTLAVASSITFQEKSIVWRPGDLLFSDSITGTSLSTTSLTASNSVATSNLTVFTTLTGTTVSTLILGSAAISNPAGSITISSVTANTATFSNTISTAQFQTSSMSGSTIYLTGNLIAPGGGYLNINSLVTSTISSGIISADTVYATNFTTTELTITNFSVTSTFIANNLSTFQASNAQIDNHGGSIATGSLTATALTAASTIVTTSGIFSTTGGAALRFVAPSVIMNGVSMSSLATSSIAASSLTATQLTIGGTPPTTVGPFFTLDSTYPSTNVTATGGPGDFLTPWFLSNVKPAGINPGDPYPVDIAFTLNQPFSGYYANILALNLFPAGELNSQINVRVYNDSNTIVSLYGLFNTNQSYATPSNTGGIPIPPDPQPSTFIRITGTMYGNSAFNMQFLSRSNDSFSAIDSNCVVTFANGALRWPYYLNGTTIQNSLNDMTLRSLYYYGSLNFASDPAVKENIAAADLARCADLVGALPLKRYKYIDSYLSTFRQADAHRLGFLATDVEAVFPKSVTYTTLPELPGAPNPIRMIDTQQIDMAHIGATKYLMRTVTELRSTVAGLRSHRG